MDSAIEVRYAGVVVGRATQVKNWTAAGAFIGFTEPLPTGTAIELRGENIAQPARVDEVLESSDPSVAGMRVSFLAAAPAAPVSDSPASDSPASDSPASDSPPGSASPAGSAEAAAPAEPPKPSDPHAHHSGGGGKRKRRR